MFVMLRSVRRSLKIKLKVSDVGIFKRNFSYLSLSQPGILNSGYPDIDIPKIPLSEFVFSKTSKWENLTAMVRVMKILNYRERYNFNLTINKY